MSARVLLLCGGKSAEHQVSLASARSVLAAAGSLRMTPLVIDPQGGLLSLEDSRRLLLGATALENTPGGQAANASSDLSRSAGGSNGITDSLRSLTDSLEREVDVVFPLLHGPYGEDGRVQGFLDLLGLPYVGSGVLGSAVGMDKLTMKAVFKAHGLPQVSHEGLNRHEWRRSPDDVLARLARLRLPLFVKPANLGSSIGIGRVDELAELAPALETALAHDRRVIVEEGVSGARELEVAVLGNDELEFSPVGEIRYESGFYDYRRKYSDGGAELFAPAELPPGLTERCQTLAREAFNAVDAAGLARVDLFYLGERDELLINEINTMPGFTPHSMYPRLWQAAGVSFEALINRLVTLAVERR